MISEKTVREHLYQKYIEPTKKERELYIGIELELPIVNLNKKAVDFANIHQVAREFAGHFQFRPSGWDDEGNMYAAECPKTGDIFSFDCSYNNLELSMGREKELHTLNERFRRYYLYLNKLLDRYHYTLTGMGVNPYRIYNHNIPIENGRYRMLFYHLGLRERGFGEECYLEPLYDRVRARENPAGRMLRERDAGSSIEEIILAYREL